MYRLTVALSLSLLVAEVSFATALPAQQLPNGVAPGQRVRVSSPAARGEFTVRSVTRDTIVVTGRDSVAIYAVPVASITRLEIGERRTEEEGFGRGMVDGFIIGGGAGFVAGLARGDDECPPGFACPIIQLTAGQKAVITGTLCGIAGALIGGSLGAMSPGYRWKRVPLEQVALSPAPGGGFTASAVLRF